MTFISYAQNFEDVMLWRALKHVEKGFYVDVGAQDPVVDSVSLAFYEHGWRGVHIEPTLHFAEKLRQQRQDEVVIQAAVSATAGTMSFFEIPDTGLSTGDKEIAEQHRRQGLTIREIAVPCLTLTQALEPYSRREIHWMKIDVEGYEAYVIEGWDAEKLKPWVVLIESTAPNSSIEVHQGWESLVLGKGYQFAYFDGLSRYYVSRDHSELLASFDRPPNVFDDFVLSGTSGIFSALLNKRLAARGAELAQTQQQLAARDAELAQTQQQLAARDAELAQTQQQLAARDAELAQTQQQLAARDTELIQTQQQVSAAESRIAALLASTSWRLTAPVRAMAAAAHRMNSAPARPVMRLKIWLKPHMVRAAAYVASRPALKSKVLRALRRFPRLHARLVHAIRPGSAISATAGRTEQAASLLVEHLTKSARRVYQDLLDALAANSKSR
jgi:FkbM family methyltransferase